MRVFGIDPGSGRTGYGCVDSDGSRHSLVTFGAITAAPGASFPDKLHAIHRTLAHLITTHRPDCVVIENVFHAKNARSALLLGHARGVAMLAAVQADLPVVEYTPAEVKLAIAICHLHTATSMTARAEKVAGCSKTAATGARPPRSWRDYRPGPTVRRTAP